MTPEASGKERYPARGSDEAPVAGCNVTCTSIEGPEANHQAEAAPGAEDRGHVRGQLEAGVIVATWGFLACCNWLVQVEYLNLQAHAQALAKVLYTL